MDPLCLIYPDGVSMMMMGNLLVTMNSSTNTCYFNVQLYPFQPSWPVATTISSALAIFVWAVPGTTKAGFASIADALNAIKNSNKPRIRFIFFVP